MDFVDWESVDISLDEVLFRLNEKWQDNPDSNYNTTAFRTKRDKVDMSRSNIQMCCPFHSERTASFGISTESPYVYHCFTCGERGNLEDLVLHVLGLNPLNMMDRAKAVNFIMGRAKVYGNKAQIDVSQLFKRKEALQEIAMEGERTSEIPYMFGRGINRRTLDKYEVCFDKAKGEVIFPVRSAEGKVFFSQKRSTWSKSFLNAEVPVKKETLYGLYYILQAPKKIDEVFVTEAIIDTLSCYMAGMPSVSVMGRILFEGQLELLKRHGIRTLHTLYDNDMWGVVATIQTCELIIRKGMPINLYVRKSPFGHWGVDGVGDFQYKDANDLLKAGVLHQTQRMTYTEFKTSLTNEAKNLITEKTGGKIKW